MKEIWTTQLSSNEKLPCSGLFFREAKNLVYTLYEVNKDTTKDGTYGNKLLVNFLDKNDGSFIQKSLLFYPVQRGITGYPDQLITKSDKLYLYSRDMRSFVCLSHDELTVEMLDMPLSNTRSPDSRSYCFGERIVRIASPFLLECVEKGSEKRLWKIQMHNWLYTEIEERNGTVFWGTAGRGGSFYGANFVTGEVCCNIKTGGTLYYGWYKNRVYACDTKGYLLEINPFQGEVISKLRLSGKMEITRTVIIEDGKLYISAWQRKDTSTHIICVDLDDN